MDRLWSPWRYRYISQVSQSAECIFCLKARESDDERNLVLYRGDHNYVLLNLYPYTNGHLMIAPYQHVATLSGAPAETLAEMIRLARRAEGHLRTAYRAPGFNFGLNIGECAGAGVAGHIHMHALPRWGGDANFMTTVAETRVLPEDLETTYHKLRPLFDAE